MKLWRERIAEARKRGWFSYDDHKAWAEPSQCYVGEMRERYGLHFNLGMTSLGNHPVGQLQLQNTIHRALYENDFATAERLLDEVEDRALAIKRRYIA